MNTPPEPSTPEELGTGALANHSPARAPASQAPYAPGSAQIRRANRFNKVARPVLRSPLHYQRTLLRRHRVGFVFQAFNLLPALTAEENITLPMLLARNKPDPAWFGEVIGTLGLGSRQRVEQRPSRGAESCMW